MLYFEPLSCRGLYIILCLSSAVETVIYVHICTACLHYYSHATTYTLSLSLSLSCRSQLEDEIILLNFILSMHYLKVVILFTGMYTA